MSTAGSRSSARAIAIRCRCPPDSAAPPWPQIVSYLRSTSASGKRVCVRAKVAAVALATWLKMMPNALFKKPTTALTGAWAVTQAAAHGAFSQGPLSPLRHSRNEAVAVCSPRRPLDIFARSCLASAVGDVLSDAHLYRQNARANLHKSFRNIQAQMPQTCALRIRETCCPWFLQSISNTRIRWNPRRH
eukprot:6203209-Pleurochrysis_carterae.AAC.1